MNFHKDFTPGSTEYQNGYHKARLVGVHGSSVWMKRKSDGKEFFLDTRILTELIVKDVLGPKIGTLFTKLLGF